MRDRHEFPPWLPPLVREQARALHSELFKAGTAEDIAVVNRLTSDPKMEGVWKYLQRHKRMNYRRTGYEHAVYDPQAHSGVNRSSFPTRAIWLQQLAMREFYIDAIRWGRMCAAPVTPAPRSYLSRVLRAEASLVEQGMSLLDLSAETKRKVAKELRRAADVYEDAAQESRAKTSKEVPRYLMAMVAQRLRDLFGTPMYGQAATVASLILGRDVTATMVRECGLWGSGRKKRA
jgi:hypothetical protein